MATFCIPVIVILLHTFICHGSEVAKDTTDQKTDTNLVVDTKYGPLRGFYLNDTRAFYGIPYAMPPTGELRWMRPNEPKSWAPKVLDATKVPKECIQKKILENPTEVSEDCLYLNVYTPVDTTPASNLPVIVIIHGGVFKIQSGLTPKSDGRYLAAAGSVVVSLNYRLGVQGFLVTDSPTITGNYGIMDQRLALKFVQKNIELFGGNPNMVTIMGPSAGAQSTAIHLTSHLSEHLFSQAMLQGDPFTQPFKKKNEMASIVGTVFAAYLNCSTIDAKCMRDRSEIDILEAQLKTESAITAGLSPSRYLKDLEVWGPVIDGLEVDANPLEAFEAGQYTGKPFIIGSNKDDSRVYTQIFGTDKISMSYYLSILMAVYEWDSVPIAEKYPPLPLRDNRDQLSAVVTDNYCGCSNRFVGRVAANQNNPVYHYIYSFPSPPSFPDTSPICVGYACHAADVVPAFGTFSLTDITPTSEMETLSDSMIYSWLNFAYTGNPADHTWSKTKEVYTHWPRYESANGWQSYDFTSSGNVVVYDYRKDYCDFWDMLGYIKEDKCSTTK